VHRSRASVPRIVLIVDDDPDTREIVAAAVSALGCMPMLAVDGVAALHACGEAMPDLAVLDVMMPGMDGLELCAQLKSRHGGELMPVLMLTARDSLGDKVAAMEKGADDYLTKPFKYQELQVRIRALLRIRDLNLDLHAKNEELRVLQSKIIEQERRLVANQLAGAAAHRLGQPLSAILLNCHLLESLMPEDPRFKNALAAIKVDCKRMVDMLENLKQVNAASTQEYFVDTKILKMGTEGDG